jgi:uncharacterized membrane protein
MEWTGLSILLAGETNATASLILKGFRAYALSGYEEDQAPLENALVSEGHRVTFLRNHEATIKFPSSLEALDEYDVVILSDIGADTLLLHPDTFQRSQITPTRLGLLADFVRGGGGLLMVGGYMSFGGLDGMAHYANTLLADVLPVVISPFDDRVEAPEGISPIATDTDHPVMANMPREFPPFLGYNRFAAKPGAQVLMKIRSDPFLVIMGVEKGRSAAFASDCAPHWAMPRYLGAQFYAPFWSGLIRWLAHK